MLVIHTQEKVVTVVTFVFMDAMNAMDAMPIHT